MNIFLKGIIMLEHLINTIVPPLIHLMELAGIIVLTIGAVKAFYFYIMTLLKRGAFPVKLEFANAMATALEFKMGAEILKTVVIKDMSEIYMLASIIALRALLSFMIHTEIKSTQKHS